MTDYRSVGIDVDAADRLVDRIGPAVTATWGPDVVGSFGGFAAGIRLPKGYERPVLMMATDGVGTKADVARLAGRFDGLGYDLVAMCIDDLAAAGAQPIALTDYVTTGRLDEDRVAAIVASIARACGSAGVALLGGETAVHPGVMRGGDFDLAGAALGILEEGRLIDGSAVSSGDRLIAVASPNLRANGFSLVRAVVLPRLDLNDAFPGTDDRVADVLLEPSVIYAPAVADVLAAAEVHGMAHITGGGLPGNLARVMPPGCRAEVRLGSWTPPAVFAEVARLGGVPAADMYRTFNMGVGFVVIVPPGEADAVTSVLGKRGHQAWELGEVVAGERGVALSG